MCLHRLATYSAIGALSLLLAACGENTRSDPRTNVPLVRVAAVQHATPAARSFTGTVAARVQSDLGFRVSGKVLERLVDPGQTVRRGQLLMRIDAIDLKLAARAQQAAVAAARARAKQTAEDETRYRSLRGTGAISASEYDQVKAAADAAKAQLNAEQAQAEVASNANQYAQLLADADGLVMETLAEPGQVVATGQVVVRIAHAGHREAVIQLPETLRPTVGATAQASLFSKPDVIIPATLRQLSDVADRLTRTFEARYVLQGEFADAPLGTTVTVTIPDEPNAAASDWQVPIGALSDSGKGPGVWVVNGKSSTIDWRQVTLRRLNVDSAFIAGQFEQGDRVVALGAHLLHEGQKVRVADQAAGLTDGSHP